MPSDKARVTFDETRRYRSVVMQQGRVTLEADWNEEAQILGDELRHDFRDVIGLFGTPDDGYRIAVANQGARSITVGAGTMYVGGLRSFLPPRADNTPYPFNEQPDWLPPDAPVQANLELVWLELFEQEISAVEDSALLEPALGGPDTAQRLRLMQRIHRTPTNAENCVSAWQEFIKTFPFDGKTMTFRSPSRLRVGFSGQGLTPDPCDPAADPGYLGAENQLIRVAVTQAGSAQRILWSFDNASAIYRVTQYDAAARTLILATRPVDDAHKPRKDQVIELLRGVARLETGMLAAEPFGPVAVLADDYAADDKMLTLTAALPAGFEPTANRPLYVRVWEESLPVTAGTAVTLGHTGIEVTLTTTAAAFIPGEFWTFALRPSTPAEVLPHRYKDAPQPPEGFRRWACPLAVLDWRKTGTPLTDCREQFDDLVTLSKRKGSCCIVVRPEDLQKRSLQQIIDTTLDEGKFAEFCLTPGEYRLDAPLLLRRPLTIVGCGPGVKIMAASTNSLVFRTGLIQIVSAFSVTLQNLEIQLPETRIVVGDDVRDINSAVGIRMVDAARCTIEDCTFKYPPVPPPTPAPTGGVGQPTGQASLSAGILAHGVLISVAIRRCMFDGEVDLLRAPLGIVCLPSIQRRAARFAAQGSLIENLTIEGNTFTRLHTAVLAWADFGEVLIRENSCIICINGFFLFARRWFAPLVFTEFTSIPGLRQVIDNATPTASQAARTAYQFSVVLLFHPSITIPTAFFATLELPAAFKLQGPDLAEGKNSTVDGFLRDFALVAGNAMDPSIGRIAPPTLLDEWIKAWQGVPKPFQQLVSPDLQRLSMTEFFTPPPAFATIDLSHNQVNRFVVAPEVGIGVSLLYVADERLGAARLILDANDFSGFAPFWPTALVLFPFRSAVTGNIIQNDFPENSDIVAPSLILIPVIRQQAGSQSQAIIAVITGNDFVGLPLLPKRLSVGGTLPPWFLLNTVVD
jgi:hypothetical protein